MLRADPSLTLDPISNPLNREEDIGIRIN